MSALTLEHVSHTYGEVVAADDLDLSVAPEELVCLLGPSGCGKTTVLRIAAGLEPLQQGRVLLDGKVVAGDGIDLPPETRNVGLVFQDFALFPHLSVRDNVAFGLSRLSAEARRGRVAAALAQVGMASHAGSYPHLLSGGEQQRVALARALAPEPKVMLLDEPFSGLDVQLRHQVRDQTLHVLKRSGAATLMVTHDPEEAMFMADRVALMRAGRLIQVGAPTDLYFAPQDAFVAGFFGDVNRLDGTVKDGRVATPFGPVTARNLDEGTPVEVLIRPEGLNLRPAEESDMPRDGLARVITSRMLGRSSLVHLSVASGPEQELHLHARIPGRFLPEESQVLEVELDRSQTFVFSVKSV
jgi:iron(III) transport system ATP-binding protein